jgi:hypothetical protein
MTSGPTDTSVNVDRTANTIDAQTTANPNRDNDTYALAEPAIKSTQNPTNRVGALL